MINGVVEVDVEGILQSDQSMGAGKYKQTAVPIVVLSFFGYGGDG